LRTRAAGSIAKSRRGSDDTETSKLRALAHPVVEWRCYDSRRHPGDHEQESAAVCGQKSRLGSGPRQRRQVHAMFGGISFKVADVVKHLLE
jgi:hypothetical protein